MASILVEPTDAISDAATVAPSITLGSVNIAALGAIVVAGIQGPWPLYPPHAAADAAADASVAVAWPPHDPSAAEAAGIDPTVILGRTIVARPIAAADAGFSPPIVDINWWDPEVAVATITSGPRNLVTNPSFETGTDGWSAYRATVSRVAGGVEGDWEAAFTLTEAGGAIYTTLVTTEPGEHTCRAWVKSDSALVYLRLWNGTDGEEEGASYHPGDGEWHLLSFSHYINAGDTCDLQIKDGRGSGWTEVRVDVAFLATLSTTVILGSTISAPAGAIAEAGGVDPAFTYGSVTVTPASSSIAEAAIVAPDVTDRLRIHVDDPPTGHAELFSAGDFLRVKVYTNDVPSVLIDNWLEVMEALDPRTHGVPGADYWEYCVDLKSGTPGTIPAGSAIVNYGASGSGYVKITSDEAYSPFIDIATHAGTPWTTITTHVRVGNLDGVLGLPVQWGMAAGTDLSDDTSPHIIMSDLQMGLFGVTQSWWNLGGTVIGQVIPSAENDEDVFWLGAGTADRRFQVTADGDVTITGTVNIANQIAAVGGTWVSVSALLVSWTDATLQMRDGTTIALDNGNTGNMAAKTYIYLHAGGAALAITTDPADLDGDDMLVAVAENGAEKASVQIVGGGIYMSGGWIMADSITATEIKAGTITATELAASYIIVTGAAGDVNDNVTTIEGGKITTNTITATQIAAAAITATEIAANTVLATNLSMGIGDSLFNAADGLLLLGPYSEINDAEWWSLRKQKAAITGALHQEIGRWSGTRGLVVEKATTNKITNPSIEVDTTGWNQWNGVTLTRVTTDSRFGAACMSILTDSSHTGEGTTRNVTSTTSASTEYTWSIWVKGTQATRIFMYDADAGYQNGDTHPADGEWHRLTVTATFGTGAARHAGVRTTGSVTTTFYVDGAQLEQLGYATTTAVAGMGAGYSTSDPCTRTVTKVDLSARRMMISSNDTFSIRCVIQAPYDADSTDWAGSAVWEVYGGANTNRLYLTFQHGIDDNFYCYINGANLLIGSAQTFKAGDWLDIVITFDFTGGAPDEYNLYINGVLDDTDDTAKTAPTFAAGGSKWMVGSSDTGDNQAGWAIAEYSVFDKALSAAEVASMYALQRPLVDAGGLDTPGIYILDGKFKMASSLTGAHIEITADYIAGYSDATTKEFYLQASDGSAQFSAGKCQLDAGGHRILTPKSEGSSLKVRWIYDDANLDFVGSIGACWETTIMVNSQESSHVFVRAQRVAGDGWADAAMTLDCNDYVASKNVYLDLFAVVEAVSVSKNLFLGAGTVPHITNDFGGGSGVFSIRNASTNPSSNPVWGGILYSDAGAGKWRGSGGTVTTFGPADPHCSVCGRDFVLEWENEEQGTHLQICMWCLAEMLRSRGADMSFLMKQTGPTTVNKISKAATAPPVRIDRHATQIRARELQKGAI